MNITLSFVGSSNIQARKDMFINVALTKINVLIKREDFKEIVFIDGKNVTIVFTNKCCNVSSFGRVTWNDDEAN